jgi:hypothetical protein
MADLSGNVKIPGLGEVPKKRALLIGGAVVVVAGVIIVRGRSASSAAAAPAADTTGGADPSIDPSTGVPYADESGAGGIDPSTDVPYADESGYGGGSYGAYPDNTNLDAAGYPIGSAQDLAYQGQQATGITTNSQWLQQAEGNVPGTQSAIQAALSGVLGGVTVTAAQKTLFLEAVGINGQPPQGYPQPIKTSDTAAHPGTTGKVTVPKVTGQPQEAAFAILAAAGFHAHGTPVVHGQTLVVDTQEPKAGASAAKGSTVTLHSAVRTPVKAPVKK